MVADANGNECRQCQEAGCDAIQFLGTAECAELRANRGYDGWESMQDMGKHRTYSLVSGGAGAAEMAARSQNPMAVALAEARRAAAVSEVPVGAVVMQGGNEVARAHNRVERYRDPTAHAEVLALRAAARAIGSPRLVDCDLYVTLEPCAMCAQAISLARIRRLYFAAYDPKAGGVEHGARVYDHPTCHHVPEVYGGIGEMEAATLLRAFFARLR